jgi:hypothetical protein
MTSQLQTDEEYFGDFIRISDLPGFEDLVVLVMCNAEDGSELTHAESLVSVLEQACKGSGGSAIADVSP